MARIPCSPAKALHENWQYGRSLLQQTFLRAATLPDVTGILTVTGQDLHLATSDEFRQVNNSGLKTPFILELFGRNTAAVVAIAALHCVQTYGEDSVMLATIKQ